MKHQNWLKCLQVALVLGIGAGAVSVAVVSDLRLYYDYGMYMTIFHVLARSLDDSVLFFIIYAGIMYGVGRLSSRLSRMLWILCSIVTGILLVGAFPEFSAAIHVPFSYDPHYPWEVVDPKLFKESWITFGVASVLVSLIVWTIFRFGRHADVAESQARDTERRRSHPVISAMLLILLLPNLTYGILFIWNRASVASKPNIIWIMCDSMRADHLSCYGYSRKTSPNIDRLAKEGTLYSRAIAQAPITMLSVPSFLTSMYPNSRKKRIPLPELIDDRGYDTAAVIANPECDIVGVAGGGVEVMRQFHTLDDGPCDDTVSSGPVVKGALKWLDKERGRPVFLFMLFMDTHAPYRRHPGYEFGAKPSGYPDVIPMKDYEPLAKRHQTPKYLEYMESLYDSGIAYTDAYIGQFLGDLKKRGMYDKSLILVMADHGEEFGNHGLMFHGRDLYDDALHVPLVVKMPDQRESRKVGGVFPLIDLYPSIGKIAGVRSSTRIQGQEQDLSGIIPPRYRYVFSSLVLDRALNKRSVEYQGKKLVYGFYKHKKELYDLKTDPSEQKNLVDKCPNEAAVFYRDLMAQEERVAGNYAGKPWTGEELSHALTKGKQDRLKALGYAQ